MNIEYPNLEREQYEDKIKQWLRSNALISRTAKKKKKNTSTEVNCSGCNNISCPVFYIAFT